MDCREVKEHIIEYLDGEADEKLADAVAEHLKSCDACRAHCDELKAVGTVLRAWTPPDPVADFVERTLAAKKTYTPARARILRLPSLKKLALAAGVVLVAGIAVWVSTGRKPGRFQIRLLNEVAYLKQIGSMIESLQSVDGLSDVANIANIGTAQGLTDNKLDSAAARSNLAVCGIIASARTPRDARLFYQFISGRQVAAAGFPSFLSAALAEEIPVGSPFSRAAVAEYGYDLETAAGVYRKLLNKPDTDSTARTRLAFIHLATGEPEKAAELIDVSMDNFDAAGKGFVRLLEKAVKRVFEARKMEAYSERKTRLLLSAGAYKDAADELKPFCKGEDDKAFLRGWALARAGRPIQAIGLLDALIDNADPESPERMLALFETALIREKLGRYKEAARFFALAAKAGKAAGDAFFTSAAEIQGVYSLVGIDDPSGIDRAKKTAQSVTDKSARELAAKLIEK